MSDIATITLFSWLTDLYKGWKIPAVNPFPNKRTGKNTVFHVAGNAPVKGREHHFTGVSAYRIYKPLNAPRHVAHARL